MKSLRLMLIFIMVSIKADDSITLDPEASTNMIPPHLRKYVNEYISRKQFKFALDINRAVTYSQELQNPKNAEQNVVFSPLNIAGTMAMILLVSGGQTFNEVVKTLGLQRGVDISRHSEIFHQMYGHMIDQINKIKGRDEPIVNYANGIFIQNDYPIRPEFRKISEKVYKSEVLNLDFQHESKVAQNTINEWVSNKTSGKINNILHIPPQVDTKVILSSALYFNGKWDIPFKKNKTERQPFYINQQKSVEVDMMANHNYFPVYVNLKTRDKIIGLPYEGKEVTMYIMLPGEEGTEGLRRLEQSLTPNYVEQLIKKMEEYEMIVWLPKMKLSSTLSLKNALQSLGLWSLFESNIADLSLLSPGNEYSNLDENQYTSDDEDNQLWTYSCQLRKFKKNVSKRRQSKHHPIYENYTEFLNSQNFPSYGLDDLRNNGTTTNPKLFATDVIHKAEISIDEEGTEAAAATIVLHLKTFRGEFIANRLFLFFIRHNPTKMILFWGKINKPEPFF